MKKFLFLASAWAVWSVASLAWSFEPLPDAPPVPADNPMSAAKVALGQQLYFDKRLSVDGTVSCNSCHSVMGSGTDNRPVSVGVGGKKGGRNAPTVWNSAFLSVQFWDGRAATLEDQAKGPIVNPVEMGMHSPADAEGRIRAIPGYVSQFEAVFGTQDPVTYDNIAKAIAAYERTLLTPHSPFDRYMKGDKTALSEQALRGMKTVERIGCTACHTGPDFAGPSMPAGQGFYQKFPIFVANNPYVAKYRLMEDEGRFNVTHEASDKHLWRVQTWRNVALTAPYFHTGSVPTLDEAVRVMARSQLGKTLTEEEVEDIVAFLNSLTGEFPAQNMPRLPQTPNRTLTAE
ncbi:cytochrome-c peroxidase [Ferrovum sp.]|uniref:cytochrome-c peroxidase n=3 Tax=Ferrovum sp. TaxID=2609467 RepID=UPI002639A9C5|nr:cytochrome c peroxidase [Ferrovum sp.]